MRVQDVFNSILQLDQALVTDVEVTGGTVVVTVDLVGPYRCGCGQEAVSYTHLTLPTTPYV